ncbi:MAG: tyrosine-type recombinase/integrase [Actinomycetota bacterium]|nr:tyrosine-type recombinase/integrase [Actinomycetota bacterium]
MTDQQLALAGDVDQVEVLDGAAVGDKELDAVAIAAAVTELALEQRNLFGEAERIAARAASAGTRRQYATIFRAFGDWLAGELDRPPVVGDLDADVIATYGRYLSSTGGRGGRPAAPATSRVYMSMVRALARDLGRDDQIGGVRVPRHEPGPPETLTDSDYFNLLRVPDRRTFAGKRDYALLRVLGDCGLRSAELRGLRAQDLRRPRSNARHYRLFIRGKGGREREVPVPEAVQHAIEAWVKVHPLARGVGLRDEQPLFVRLGRYAHEEPVALSAEAVYRVVRRDCLAAGVPDRLAHPHALRAYWATHCLEAGVSVHEVSARLGHVDLRTTARYAAARPERTDEIADVLDRHHQAARRAAGGSAAFGVAAGTS